jgi:hypothetical protein
MTQSDHKVFVDRRTEEEQNSSLATQVLYWYDLEGTGRKRRRRTNGMAVTTDGQLVVARATCSRKDQFEKKMGRLVVSKRICGRAQRHCWVLGVDPALDAPEGMAAAYRALFPADETGIKRAYNAGKIFATYREYMDDLARSMMDEV